VPADISEKALQNPKCTVVKCSKTLRWGPERHLDFLYPFPSEVAYMVETPCYKLKGLQFKS
jgi:hypothetical protein